MRKELVSRQREWAVRQGGGVLEGRDIGTVVFPDAELKVYLTADPEERARRRAKEVTDLDYEQVAADIARRDALDTTGPPTRWSRPPTPLSSTRPASASTRWSPRSPHCSTRSLVVTANRYGDQDVDGVERSKQTLGGRILYWILWRVFYALILVLFRLRVEGRKNLPEGRSSSAACTAPSSTRRSSAWSPLDACGSWARRASGSPNRSVPSFPSWAASRSNAALPIALRCGQHRMCSPWRTARDVSGGHCQEGLAWREQVLDGPGLRGCPCRCPIVPVGIGGSVKASHSVRRSRPRKVVACDRRSDLPTDVRGRVPRGAVTDLTDTLYAELSDPTSRRECSLVTSPLPSSSRLTLLRRVAAVRRDGRSC